MIKLQEKMFALVQAWQESGQTRRKFLSDKDIGQPKFDYWLHKYRRESSGSHSNLSTQHTAQDFKSFVLSDDQATDRRQSIRMEIDTPSGVRITIYH